MATYKQPCIHCGELVDTSARSCPKCGSHSLFGYACPACLHAVQPDWQTCPGCGRNLTIVCPHCGGPTFAGETCQRCGESLMVTCANTRCGQAQFFENKHCTACGRKITAKLTTKPYRKDQLR